MKKKISIILSCRGIGDILSAVPSIRYISKLYGYKILVFTHSPDIFKNYPYIIPYHIDRYKDYENEYDIVSTFRVDNFIHSKMDIRQIHAVSLGFELSPEELVVDFYPDDYINIDGLPDSYITLHVSSTWPSRTWEVGMWQRLVDDLGDRDINVVLIGKDTGAEVGTFKISKMVHKIKGGIDLTNKLTISQVWHVIDKSNVLVTMDSGILHLGGTTDTHIVQLGSSINPKYRTPYRNGSQSYKMSYIMGKCGLFCASNLKYSMMYNNTHHKMPPVSFCLEKPDTIGNNHNFSNEVYECHPTSDQVLKEILRLYKYYNFA